MGRIMPKLTGMSEARQLASHANTRLGVTNMAGSRMVIQRKRTVPGMAREVLTPTVLESPPGKGNESEI